jgi:hypothetical protein
MDEEAATGNTWLGEVAVPPIEEIAVDSEFVPEVITREEFELVWRQAHEAAE